ncbi:MAG: Flp pilus assembly complex ATPase component [Lentisphaerae bacterium]|nr:Flp pilus assembly complex ATPase component [Lentisphaerota bacterium]MCP4102259.1 Flp pilus assembly complex ATPase component [Lentisphaerota bacterium]
MEKNNNSYDQLLSELRLKISAHYPDYEQELVGRSPLELDRRLCELGTVTESDIVTIYNEVTGIPCLDENELVPPEQFPDISQDYLTGNCVLPYDWNEENVTLLISNPYMRSAHYYFFKTYFNLEADFRLVRRSLLERVINIAYTDNDKDEGLSLEGDEDTLRNLASEARVVRLVNEMLTQAIEQEASDIHIEPEASHMSIRFRIDGILRDYLTCPLSDYPAIASRIKLLGGLNIAESRLPQDGRTNFHVGRYDIDIRISTIPIMEGESIVMRILRKDAMAFDLAKLGMSRHCLDRFDKLINIPHGIILVVGPTGSGKTTTLYSVMQQLNNKARKIITVEDPVEYQLPGLCQMQVNAKIGLSFASGLRSIVRQDPDVILVGEIRDRETADIAINAALTGHLVLSTLHTNDAAGAITRLIDMGVESFLVASALFGVLSQRLIRRICSDCEGTGINVNMTGNRCRKCGGSGYKGRTGIYELLMIDDEVRRAVIANSSSAEINKIGVKNGMIPLLEDGMRKVKEKITTQAEIKRTASDM